MKRHYLSPLLILFLLTGCNGEQPQSSSTEPSSESSEPVSSSIEPKVETVNIIMTGATVPPVMSALESLVNGGKTYAYIERGKTYSGIADTSFINMGFDVTVNNSNWVTNKNFPILKNSVSEIKNQYPEAHYNFFTVDYKPWAPVKVASEVGLSKDQFTVYMVEDGTATYAYAEKYYQSSFKNQQAADDYYDAQVKASNELFDKAMESSVHIDSVKDTYLTGYQYTFALATHPNFVHLVQDKVKLEAKLNKYPNSKINQVYGLTNNTSGYESHIVYKSISERVSSLTKEQKDEYLTLMFGQYKRESERLLNRTKLDDGETSIPSKKLIFIGGRVRQSGAELVSFHEFSKIPSNYSDISAELHQVFLNEDDYNFVYNYLNTPSNYESSWASESEEVLNAIKEKAFNYYIDYAYNLKLTYRLYGNKYDVLFKGHPAETLDAPEKWGGYSVKVDEVTYNFNRFMHALALKFHSLDSEGKYIGVLPGGVAAENLAYLGVNTYLCGLASSTYTGYEKTSPIFYVLNNTNDDIRGDIAINQRYLDGELTWEEGEEVIETKFLNRGNRYQLLKDYYKTLSDSSTDEKEKEDFLWVSNNYQSRLKAWVETVSGLADGSGASVDNIGRIIFTSSQLISLRDTYNDLIDAYLNSKSISSLSEEKQIEAKLLEQEAKSIVYGTDDLYEMKEALNQLKTDIETLLE